MMDEEAIGLAKALLSSGQEQYLESFSVTDSAGNKTEQVIVVMAVRTNKRDAERFRKALEVTSYKSVAGPKGVPCPVCGGSGRV